MTDYGSASAIGSYCQAARQLRRAARNVISGPLDWVFADRLAILACIENDFEGLCAWDNLVITADLTRLQDRVFGVDFFHQFPRDPEGRLQVYRLREARNDYLARLNHLIANYRAISGRHLFVWAVDHKNLRGSPTHAAACEVLAALRRRNPLCELLVVQNDAPHEPPWDNGTINRYTIPTPGAWQQAVGWAACSPPPSIKACATQDPKPPVRLRPLCAQVVRSRSPSRALSISRFPQAAAGATLNRNQEAPLRHIQMTISQNAIQTFQGVFDCVDLGDLTEAVSEGIRAFQRANPKLTKHTRLDPLSIDLREV